MLYPCFKSACHSIPKPSSGWDGAEPALVLAGWRGLRAQAGAGAHFLPGSDKMCFHSRLCADHRPHERAGVAHLGAEETWLGLAIHLQFAPGGEAVSGCWSRAGLEPFGFLQGIGFQPWSRLENLPICHGTSHGLGWEGHRSSSHSMGTPSTLPGCSKPCPALMGPVWSCPDVQEKALGDQGGFSWDRNCGGLSSHQCCSHMGKNAAALGHSSGGFGDFGGGCTQLSKPGGLGSAKTSGTAEGRMGNEEQGSSLTHPTLPGLRVQLAAPSPAPPPN